MAREMKDSGIEWIGEIPSEWNMSRLLWCLEEIKEKNDPIKTTNVLSLTNKLGVIPYEEKGNQGNKAKEDYSQYGLAFENTLVINSMNVLIGSVGISQYYGCVSPVYYVFRNTNKADLRFVNYIFQNIGFQKELRKFANGILEIRMRISSHDMLRRIIPLPTLEEQCRISDFLDSECTRIDSVIEQTRASIEEYKKLKQAVITQAVTKGIRPDRLMMDSGIEWIGEIPENWSIMPIKRILSEQTKKTIDGEGMQLSVNQKKGVVKSEESGAANPSQSTVDWKYVSVNDIVFNKYKAHSGVFFVSNYDGIVTFNYSVFRCLEDNCPQFFEYQFKTSGCIDEFKKQMRGVGDSISPLYTRDLFKIFVAVPPAAEQYEIAHYILENNKEIDGFIEKKEEIIEELNTYKKSLIYEYVTGKKEVPA